MMKLRLNKLYLCACLALLFGSGCAEDPARRTLAASNLTKTGNEEKVKKLFEYIYERDKTLKKTPEWLKAAYSGLKIKKIEDIPKGEYQTYKKYLTGKNIYFIVHPGYYAFIDTHKTTPLSKENINGFPLKNISERILDTFPADDLTARVVKEEEKLTREFLEFMSTEKKLVILVLPRDYKANLNFGFETRLDEYGRYINELTNFSESVIYVESEGPSDGFVKKMT